MNDALYREILMDHAKHPRCFGVMTDVHASWHEANSSCGDEIDVFVRVREDGCIERMGWTGRGCAVSQAAASMLAESIPGTPLDEIAVWTIETLRDRFGLSVGPMRIRCATLALVALQNALNLWQTSSSQTSP